MSTVNDESVNDESVNDQIEQFIQSKVLPEYRPIVAALRELMKSAAPEAEEIMRSGTEAYYGVPSYRIKRIIALISPTKKGITFAFSQGAKFKDTYGLLEGVGKVAKNVRMSSMDEFNEEALRDYIRQAVEIEKSK